MSTEELLVRPIRSGDKFDFGLGSFGPHNGNPVHPRMADVKYIWDRETKGEQRAVGGDAVETTSQPQVQKNEGYAGNLNMSATTIDEYTSTSDKYTSGSDKYTSGSDRYTFSSEMSPHEMRILRHFRFGGRPKDFETREAVDKRINGVIEMLNQLVDRGPFRQKHGT